MDALVGRRDFIKLAAAAPLLVPMYLASDAGRSEPSYEPGDYIYILMSYPIAELLPVVVMACKENSHIFPLEPEIEVAKLRQESNFVPDAISWAGAVGIAQFIPETASRGFGMTVYVTEDYWKGLEYRKEYLKNERLVQSHLAKNDFRSVRRYKLEADKWGKVARECLERYRQNLKEKIAGMSPGERGAFDNRLDTERCVRAGVEHLANMCRACSKRFGGDSRHNVLRGLAAYNAGLSRVYESRGLPYTYETVDYVRSIMLIYDRLLMTKPQAPRLRLRPPILRFEG